MNLCVTSRKTHAIFFIFYFIFCFFFLFLYFFFPILSAFVPSREAPVIFVTSFHPSGYSYVRMYRGADKSLARPGRKQANVSVRRSCRREKRLLFSLRRSIHLVILMSACIGVLISP